MESRHRLRAGSHRRSVLLDEDGFGLVELVMALLLAVALVVAFSGTLKGSLGASRENRFRQEGTTFAMERLELARTLRWEALAMTGMDPDAPLIDPVRGVLLGSLADLAGDEDLRLCDTGALEPRLDFKAQGVDYTVWTFVTQPAPALRRVYVRVEWTTDAGVRSTRTSTLISTISAGTAWVTSSSTFPDAAILAVGSVLLHPGRTVSVPAGSRAAHVLANGNFGNSDSEVDGNIVTGGTANANPLLVAGTIEQNAGSPVDLPGVEEIEAWRADLLAQARAGTTLFGNQRFKDTTVTAPIYVDGNLTIEGVVTILGSGPVYAKGAVKLQGGPTVTTEAAFLVSDVLVEFSGGASYLVTDLGTGSVVNGGVVSFGARKDALKLTGGSAGYTQGVAYAPYGGIVLSGTAAWRGALIAGGTNGLGAVDLSGGSRVEYPAGLLPGSQVLAPLAPAAPERTCS